MLRDGELYETYLMPMLLLLARQSQYLQEILMPLVPATTPNPLII